MASYQVLTLLALQIACLSVGAQHYYQPFKSSINRANHPDRPSWFSHYRDLHEFSASEPYVSYSSFPRIYRDGSNSESGLEKLVDSLAASGVKKIPRENKNYKKAVSPFYRIADKSLISKSGLPHCERIRIKRTADGQLKKEDESMVCYKCKNPKGGETYEHCLFVSEPASKSSSKEDKSAGVASFRSRRSNRDEDLISKTDFKTSGNPYRFGEDIFADLSESVPAQYKSKDEKCEKVLKDDMVCMVCEDKKTNGKYEQCSYVRQPTKKAYRYVKSSSFKDPGKEARKEEEDESANPESSEQSEPTKEERKFSHPVEEYRNDRKQDAKLAEENEETSDCKEILKDSQSCMVCKDKKTGGTYEKCSYSYQPNDKVYKFSRSKSFGQPRSSSEEEEKSPEYKEKSSSDEQPESYSKYTRDYYFPSDFYNKEEEEKSAPEYADEKSSSYRAEPSYDFESSGKEKETDRSSPYKSESEAASANIDASNCKKVQKDSMSCEVCKDPKTGNDFERCSYTYKPDDKSYSYSKSRSFGSPTKGESGQSAGYTDETSKDSGEYPRVERTYEFPSDSKGYDSSSESKEEFHEFPETSETKSSVKEEPITKKSETIIDKSSDKGFYDTLKKKAEIEKILEEFQEDRTNCKKVMRDKMTCYQCVDEKGFQKEECAFATTREPTKDKLAYREIKEVQVEPKPSKKVPRSVDSRKIQRRVDDFYLEPLTASSQDQPIKEESTESNEEESKAATPDAQEETERFAAETKPVFDKVLGLSLPAYMLEVSEHEAEFDETVASSRL